MFAVRSAPIIGSDFPNDRDAVQMPAATLESVADYVYMVVQSTTTGSQ